MRPSLSLQDTLVPKTLVLAPLRALVEDMARNLDARAGRRVATFKPPTTRWGEAAEEVDAPLEPTVTVNAALIESDEDRGPRTWEASLRLCERDQPYFVCASLARFAPPDDAEPHHREASSAFFSSLAWLAHRGLLSRIVIDEVGGGRRGRARALASQAVC